MLRVGNITLYNLDKQIIEKEYEYPTHFLRELGDPYGCLDPIKGIVA